MANTKDRGTREIRKPRQPLPEVPDLGVLAMPRKGNRQAAKHVASIGPLWDRRRADRVARRRALQREQALSSDPRKQHLDKGVRKHLERSLEGWSFDHRLRAFVPVDEAADRLEELLDALSTLGPEAITIRIADLPMKAVARVRGYLPQGSHLVPVRPRLT